MFAPLKTGIAFLLSALAIAPSRNLGISALPAIPTADNELPLTLRVAKAVKPSDTPGGIADSLLGARDLDVAPEVKTVITFDADYKARVVTMPSAAADDVVCVASDDDVLATITRDDPTTETSPHSAVVNPDHGAELAAGIVELMEAQKPSRNLASLINAIVDKAKKSEVDLSGFTIVHTTVGEGSLKIYLSGAGTLVGKLADVSQEAAEADVAKPSRW